MFTAEIEHETTKLRVTPETQPNSALITRELRRRGEAAERTTNTFEQRTANIEQRLTQKRKINK